MPCRAAFLAFEQGRALGAEMQHQVGIEDRLRRGDAAGAVEHFLGEEVRMAAAGDIDQPVGGERGGDRSHRASSAVACSASTRSRMATIWSR